MFLYLQRWMHGQNVLFINQQDIKLRLQMKHHIQKKVVMPDHTGDIDDDIGNIRRIVQTGAEQCDVEYRNDVTHTTSYVQTYPEMDPATEKSYTQLQTKRTIRSEYPVTHIHSPQQYAERSEMDNDRYVYISLN